jgi:hypothetical protein
MCSSFKTQDYPSFASRKAVNIPTGPPPTMRISVSDGILEETMAVFGFNGDERVVVMS